MTDDKAKPVDHVRLGNVKAAIWKNETADSAVLYNVTVERLYKKEGKWQSSKSFSRDDLLVLAKVADLAHTRIHELQGEAREITPVAS